MQFTVNLTKFTDGLLCGSLHGIQNVGPLVTCVHNCVVSKIVSQSINSNYSYHNYILLAGVECLPV